MKNITINSLEKLFNNVELHTPLDFDVYCIDGDKVTFNKDEVIRLAFALGFREKRITTRCVNCKMEYPFSFSVNGDRISYGMVSAVGFSLSLLNDLLLDRKEGLDHLDKSFNVEDVADDGVHFFEYLFSCTNEPEFHKYKMFISIEKKNNSIRVTKIGQFPSIIDVRGFDFECYKKQLNAINAYQDFKRAELCISDGFSAGAYTYLRRVFEKMLNKYCEGLTLEDNRSETKIRACKPSFDPRVHKLLPRLYKVLSKGIHELDDSDSQNYYDYLRIIIVMQLEYVKENDDKESQTKMLDDKLNDIISKIGD